MHHRRPAMREFLADRFVRVRRPRGSISPPARRCGSASRRRNASRRRSRGTIAARTLRDLRHPLLNALLDYGMRRPRAGRSRRTQRRCRARRRPRGVGAPAARRALHAHRAACRCLPIVAHRAARRRLGVAAGPSTPAERVAARASGRRAVVRSASCCSPGRVSTPRRSARSRRRAARRRRDCRRTQGSGLRTFRLLAARMARLAGLRAGRGSVARPACPWFANARWRVTSACCSTTLGGDSGRAARCFRLSWRIAQRAAARPAPIRPLERAAAARDGSIRWGLRR